MPNIPNGALPNEGRRERLRILSELLHASTPAFYCRSWMPYLRIVLVLVLTPAFYCRSWVPYLRIVLVLVPVVALVAAAHRLVVGSWL